MRNYIYTMCVIGLLFSCTDDRYLEIDYIIEGWQKDSLVTVTSDNVSGEELASSTRIFGSLMPDTLTLDYQYMEFKNSFLDVTKTESYNVVENGTFKIQSDSLFFYSQNDSSRFKIASKTETNLIFETTSYVANYKIQKLTHYSQVELGQTNISFKNDIFDPIIFNNGEGKCMPCHAEGTSYPVVFSNVNTAYQELINGYSLAGEILIDLENPEESYLYRVVNRQETINMPISDDEALNSDQIDLFLKWIEQGAPNN
jgi:hypothetical protein